MPSSTNRSRRRSVAASAAAPSTPNAPFAAAKTLILRDKPRLVRPLFSSVRGCPLSERVGRCSDKMSSTRLLRSNVLTTDATPAAVEEGSRLFRATSIMTLQTRVCDTFCSLSSSTQPFSCGTQDNTTRCWPPSNVEPSRGLHAVCGVPCALSRVGVLVYDLDREGQTWGRV